MPVNLPVMPGSHRDLGFGLDQMHVDDALHAAHEKSRDRPSSVAAPTIGTRGAKLAPGLLGWRTPILKTWCVASGLDHL
jgi:hypothetical protein